MRVTIGITRDALTSIEATIATSDPTLETGGALFGHEDTPHITTASGPGPNAIHRPRYFLRDLEYAQRAAASAFLTDRSLWIGEWHTHPDGQPEPSQLDLNTYVSHLVDPELQFEQFVALVWCSNTSPRLSAWLLTGTAHGIELHSARLAVPA